MTTFEVDVYLDEIYVKTIFVPAHDEDEALDNARHRTNIDYELA